MTRKFSTYAHFLKKDYIVLTAEDPQAAAVIMADQPAIDLIGTD